MHYVTGVLSLKTNPLQFGLQFHVWFFFFSQLCFQLFCNLLNKSVKSLINKSIEIILLFSVSSEGVTGRVWRWPLNKWPKTKRMPRRYGLLKGWSSIEVSLY
jgi:hypothetical protein